MSIDAGDVWVTGTGTADDPWRIPVWREGSYAVLKWWESNATMTTAVARSEHDTIAALVAINDNPSWRLASIVVKHHETVLPDL